MSQTYAQIQKQIESLQQKAEALRQSELKGVVDRIKIAIAHYGLTPEQLFGSPASARKASAQAPASSTASAPKFSDGKGNSWSGRGPRPGWLRKAMEAGAQLDDFKSAAPSAATPRVSPTVKRSKRAPSKVVYTDGAGHRWTGRGPKPGWVKAALAAGKNLQDLVQ